MSIRARLPSLIRGVAFCCAITVLMTACGGGGGGGGSSQPPSTPAITPSSTAPKPGDVVTFAAQSADPQGSAITFTWDFGDSTTATGAAPAHTYPAEGSFNVAVTATDSAGLHSGSSITLTVAAQAPTTPLVAISNAAPKPGEEISVSASSTDPQGSALTYNWDFADGNTATGASQTHTYPAPGTFLVHVVITDTFGKSAQQGVTANVVAQAPVIQSAGSSVTQPKPYDGVTFSAAATDPQGSGLSYSWDFKDGVTATGQVVNHAYRSEGNYAATVTVSDTFGKAASANASVSVVALPPRISAGTASIIQPKPNDVIKYSVTADDPQGSALTYHWDFGDGTTAATAAASHAWTTEGTFHPQVLVSNAFGKSTSLGFTYNVIALAPTTPILTFLPAQPKPGDGISASVASTDPQGSALTYRWAFGDGQTGTGAATTHSYAAEGTFNVQVTATDAFSKASTGGSNLTVAYRPPTAPAITPAGTTVLVNQPTTFTAQSSDPGGYAVTYGWDFGDGTTAGNVTSQTHAYAAAGRYTITVTATNSLGKSATATAAVGVTSGAIDNEFNVYCLGASCGALDPGTYRGSGVGIWRYNNTTSSPVNLNIAISGVQPGQQAMLLFSNGGTADTTTPSNGTLLGPPATPKTTVTPSAAPPAMLARSRRFAVAHSQMLARNRQLTLSFARSGRRTAPARSATPARPAATPAVGATRTWIDYFPATPVAYTAAVVATCPVPVGRNIVFWVDPTLTNLPTSELTAFQNAFCGAGGGYDRVTALIGDAWGPTPAADQSTLIQDTPALQDVNVVFLNVPANTGWGGYFYGANNSQSTANQALVFFINGPNSIGAQDYYISVLIHELTHMVNFYQRSVAHGVGHDTWLEESSAMMTEDIVGPSISPTGYNTVRDIRTWDYFSSGGDVSLINWQQLSSASYGMGGSFGAFLSRRYGVSLYQQISTCGEAAPTLGTSYQCVDALVQGLGGAGYADEFARFGVSLFDRLGDSGVPGGFGYPSLLSGAYLLEPYPLPTILALPLPDPAPLASTLPPTSHTYLLEPIAAGASAYARTAITVPANSTLLVVIK